MTMTKPKKYGRGGKPLFVRLGTTERAAWERCKDHLENSLGRPVSHSAIISKLLEGYSPNA